MRTRHTVTAGQDSSQTLRVGRFIFLKADIREGWAQKNRGVGIGYLKALVSTYQWLHDNREEALKLLTSITKLDKKYIPKSCETYTKTQIWPRTGEVNLKGVQTLARLMEEEGALKKPLPKPEDIVDLSYLEEARRGLAH
jgi:ABC-type nitrate/sulfonate/bicarbonate transport system substrate-binding protein